MCSLSPRESGEFVAKHSQNVSINRDGVERVADMVLSVSREAGSCSMIGQQYAIHPTHPARDHQSVIDWIFVISTLNFSFWTPDGQTKYLVTWQGCQYSGYYALCAAIKRAVHSGSDIVLPRHYATIDRQQLSSLLRSDTGEDIPLLEERVQALHEAGRVLQDKFDGSFVNCVTAAACSAQRLVQLIVDNFSSFRDDATYAGRTVSFYKRAQICVSDVWACCGTRAGSSCSFSDIDSLTMFADYRVPQVLHHLGVLRYSPRLLQTLTRDEPLCSGSDLEVEIRGCSIEAVERIVREARRRCSDDTSINSALVDYFLWCYRRQHNSEIKSPYHKTRCMYY